MRTLTQAKRIVIGLLGGTVLLLGIVLIVLPGPALLIIPAGLAILATEFAWAKRWLDKIKGFVKKRGAKKQEAAARTK